MTKKVFLMFLSLILSVTYLSAQVVQTVNVPTAGGLATAIGSNLKTVTDLTMTGTINANDFQTIKQMTALKNLDMSKVDVVEKAIPQRAFENRVLNSLTLSESIETIERFAFSRLKCSNIDFSQATNLEEIAGGAFYQSTIASLDFSKNEKLKRLTAITDYGTFTGYKGHVILPKNLEILDSWAFLEFQGTVDLPTTLKVIGHNVFHSSVMPELILPASIDTIKKLAFNNAKISTKLVLPPNIKKIENQTFQYFQCPELDFSQATNLEEIAGGAFYQSTIASLDFSKNEKLKRLTAITDYGTFTGYKGHVILPKNLEILESWAFLEFQGTVDLPVTLRIIGKSAFQSSIMSTLVLPTSIDTIKKLAFNNAKISTKLVLPPNIKKIENQTFQYFQCPELDFSQATNLEEIAGGAFYQSTIASLDFSKNEKLKRLTAITDYGTFTGYKGHVILPKNLEILDSWAFLEFQGTVDLPVTLRVIEKSAFQSSTITSIELPSSLTSIVSNAFNNATKLEKIISHNPTPPALGSNVFAGVNKQTTVLEVPKESVNLYGTAAQWKDFLNIKTIRPTLPNKINLLYRIGRSHQAYPPPNNTVGNGFNTDRDGILDVNYEAVRIGEYYWMNQNFNHEEYKRHTWTGGYFSGMENDAPMSQEVINKYLKIVDIDQSQYQVDINQYTKDYGVYYGILSRNYMQKWGKIFENVQDPESIAWETPGVKGWGLPSVKDFRQLVAMSQFRHYVQSDILESRDVLYTFAPSLESNEMSQYQFDLKTNCYDPTSNQYTTTDWYGIKYGLLDKYGFNLMLGGARMNEVDSGDNSQSWTTADCQGNPLVAKQARTGDLYHLFYTTELAASDGFFNLHDHIDTYSIQSDHWMHTRWCRPLTDEELGYKLYIDIKNVDKNSNEWLSLKSGNEIPLLIKYRYSDLDRSQVSIIKLGLGESAPEGYIELPHGYIRGFYVNYLLDNPNPSVDLTKVITYACSVDDGVLGRKRPEPQGVTTKSLSVDNVVIPFKADASVTLYPNPVQDVLNISGDGVEKVSIYDMTGRQVTTAKNTNTVSVSDLKTGTYIVKVLTAKGESTHKVMKK